MKNITVVKNAVIQDALSILRQKDTNTELFRFHSDRLCRILLSYAFQDISLQNVEIQTPLMKMTSQQMTNDIVIIPILRAGLALLPSALQFIPTAKIGFAGLARNEETAVAYEYYWKMPSIYEKSVVCIIDPMLATGGSIIHVLEKLKEKKIIDIRIISVIAAPEGITAIQNKFSDINIFVATIDEKLNTQKYIIPGLGDYGDRYFGTQHSIENS